MSAAEPRWLNVRLTAPAELAERLSEALLTHGALSVGIESAIGIGVAGDIEPVPAPAFAEVR